jgi:hypothetical protein
VQVQLGLGELQPAPLDPAAVLLEVPGPTAQPADRDRALAAVEVLVEQPRRRPSRPPIVPRVPEGGIGPLAGGDRLVGRAQPPGGLGQRLQLQRRQAARVTSAEILIELEPGGQFGRSPAAGLRRLCAPPPTSYGRS